MAKEDELNTGVGSLRQHAISQKLRFCGGLLNDWPNFYVPNLMELPLQIQILRWNRKL